MNKADKYYIDNLNLIKNEGTFDVNPRPKYKDGTPAHTKFVTQIFEKYDISKGEFPITTLRNTAIKMGINEVLWIYQKQNSDLESAKSLGVNWWDNWDIGDNTIGNRYGQTVSNYDLMNKLLNDLEKNPFGRRHIMNMYQYSDLNSSDGLYPCAYETIWSVRQIGEDMFVDLTLVQRSNDYIMAGFINKVQYVSLLMMVCGHLGYKPGVFSHLVQNLHVYDRHFDAMEEILNRKPLYTSPSISLKENKDFYDYTIDDFVISGLTGIKKLESPLEIAI